MAVNWLQDLFPEVADALGVGQGRIARTAFGILKRLRDASLHSSRRNIAIVGCMVRRYRNI